MKTYTLTASVLTVLLLVGCGSDDTQSAMNQSEIYEANQAIINETITENLTNEQKFTLAYMWNEEKLAKDIYLELNKVHPSNTLYNIATRAETKHQASVEV